MKPKDKVLEVSVGVGHYSEFIAMLGAQINLVDLTQKFLQVAQNRLKEAKLEHQLLGATRTSGTKLQMFEKESFDVVLLLEPLYHLITLEERRECVRQALRVLKPKGYMVSHIF